MANQPEPAEPLLEQCLICRNQILTPTPTSPNSPRKENDENHLRDDDGGVRNPMTRRKCGERLEILLNLMNTHIGMSNYSFWDSLESLECLGSFKFCPKCSEVLDYLASLQDALDRTKSFIDSQLEWISDKVAESEEIRQSVSKEEKNEADLQEIRIRSALLGFKEQVNSGPENFVEEDIIHHLELQMQPGPSTPDPDVNQCDWISDTELVNTFENFETYGDNGDMEEDKFGVGDENIEMDPYGVGRPTRKRKLNRGKVDDKKILKSSNQPNIPKRPRTNKERGYQIVIARDCESDNLENVDPEPGPSHTVWISREPWCKKVECIRPRRQLKPKKLTKRQQKLASEDKVTLDSRTPRLILQDFLDLVPIGKKETLGQFTNCRFSVRVKSKPSWSKSEFKMGLPIGKRCGRPRSDPKIGKVNGKSNKTYKCTTCGKIFLSRTGRRYHEISTHNADLFKGKWFVCEICGERFQRKSHYNLHILKHPVEEMETESSTSEHEQEEASNDTKNYEIFDGTHFLLP